MQEYFRSPWFALILLIAGLVVGYSFVVITREDAFAAATQCPYKQHACKGDACDTLCNGKDCARGCTGNCAKGKS